MMIYQALYCVNRYYLMFIIVYWNIGDAKGAMTQGQGRTAVRPYGFASDVEIIRSFPGKEGIQTLRRAKAVLGRAVDSCFRGNDGAGRNHNGNFGAR